MRMIANLAEPEVKFPTGLGFLREMKKADGGRRKNYFRGMMPLMFHTNIFYAFWGAGIAALAASAEDVMPTGGHGFSTPMIYGTACLLPMPLASIFSYPLNTIGVRMSLDAGRAEKKYRNSWRCFRHIVKEEGYRSLYRGQTAFMAR